jgi:peptidoglycan/xylan/chitin deacetylase (PgdA/CDA1 family)
MRPDEIFRVPVRANVIALTFDDGPSATYMAEVLDVLDRERVKGTFFLVGDRMAATSGEGAHQRRANVQRAARDGHEIAFHGWKHESVAKSNEQAFTEDLRRFRMELNELAPGANHGSIRFFRPPFGATREFVFRVTRRLSMRVVEADVLPGDRYFFPAYFLEDEKRAVDRVVREVRPGSVVCLHIGEDLGQKDSVYNAVNAGWIVSRVIPRLRKQGYRFATVSELVAMSGRK